jgi:hypothetical protein
MNLHPEPSLERRARAHTASTWLHQARSALRQLRDLLTNDLYAGDREFRLGLAEDLLREIESLGLTAGRPTVRRTAAHVRAAIGLSTNESTVYMPVETALAFLALAIDPPETDGLPGTGPSSTCQVP